MKRSAATVAREIEAIRTYPHDWRAHDAAIPFRAPRPPALPLRDVAPPEVDERGGKPVHGRRITWEALWRERPDLRPESAARGANDNGRDKRGAAA